MELTVNICAKINLSLNILGILDNGYHDVDTVMQSVSLYDTLTVRPAPVLTVDCPGVPQEQNTAYKAARLFFAESGIPGGAEVTIKKGIPFASGMGGSSADAAGLLVALNHMYDAPLSHQALLHIGARIGADVCFLMEGGAMRCQGIGEQLTPVINRWDPVYLAVRADGFVTAGQAYHQFDTLGGASCDTDAVLAALAVLTQVGIGVAGQCTGQTCFLTGLQHDDDDQSQGHQCLQNDHNSFHLFNLPPLCGSAALQRTKFYK